MEKSLRQKTPFSSRFVLDQDFVFNTGLHLDGAPRPGVTAAWISCGSPRSDALHGASARETGRRSAEVGDVRERRRSSGGAQRSRAGLDRSQDSDEHDEKKDPPKPAPAHGSTSQGTGRRQCRTMQKYESAIQLLRVLAL